MSKYVQNESRKIWDNVYRNFGEGKICSKTDEESIREDWEQVGKYFRDIMGDK